VPWGDPRILEQILREAQNIRNPRKRRVFEKAAVQTGLVESGGRNLNYGDADSQGWRQERASLYDNPTNVKASVRRFRQEFQQFYDPGEKSYEVAAQVQRPAAQYAGRYRDVRAEARQLLRGVDRPGAPEPRRGGPDAQISLPAGGGPRQLSGGSQGVAALLAQLQGEKQPIQSAGLQGPAHSAGAAMPEGYQLPAAGGGPAPKRDLRGLLEAIGTPGGGIDRASSPGVQVPGVQGTPGQRNSGGQPARQRGSLAGGNRNTTAKGIGSKLEEFAQEQGWPIGSGKRNYVPPGGSSTSDHFWQDGEWARDFPLSNQGDIDKAGRKVARQLGIDGIDSSGFTERVVKLGRHRYKVQIITKPHGTGPHLHVGVQRV
jgi:hypothetical protein